MAMIRRGYGGRGGGAGREGRQTSSTTPVNVVTRSSSGCVGVVRAARKKAREKRKSRPEKILLRCGGQYLREGLGSCEFQPWDVIAPAGYSDLLGYYRSCVRKVRPAWYMDFFNRSSIYRAAQCGVGALKINQLFCDGAESEERFVIISHVIVSKEPSWRRPCLGTSKCWQLSTGRSIDSAASHDHVD
ncbi:hypothetical protein K0M31_010876 [Melipona bicolor]|uniref:Uncharacterized protein n=1 Tax=Melipona bicolor TaxID=60889 RepID=A0AA40KI18_9HYME|nr:hypothetical protein K0M31_010876 [Melipona bicolor]